MIVVCSRCLRQVEHTFARHSRICWWHCEDRSAICEGARAIYPKRLSPRISLAPKEDFA